METKQALVLPSGWEALPINPYKNGTGKHRIFERDNRSTFLTQYHTPLEKVTVREVWQFQNRHSNNWNTVHPQDIQLKQTFNEWASACHNVHDWATRAVFEVVSEEESKVCNHINKFIGINGLYAKCKDCGVLLKPIDGNWELLSREDYTSVYVIPEDNMKIDKASTHELSVEEAAEKLYPFSEVKLIATRFARQSRLMNDVTSNDTITSFDNWFKPEHFKSADIIQSGEYVSLKDLEKALKANHIMDYKIARILTTLKNKQ